MIKYTLLAVLTLCLVSCNTSESRKAEKLQHTVIVNGLLIKKNDCLITNYFPQQEADSLHVDMVTFIGRKPPLATSTSRFDELFRSYYVSYANEFKQLYFVIAPDGTHYYFLSRPGRSTEGNRRGVGGSFRMDNGRITGFQELFNTPVTTEEELINTGWILFKHMVEHGHVDDYIGNDQYIEWPDDRLQYDRELFEWRYINQG